MWRNNSAGGFMADNVEFVPVDERVSAAKGKLVILRPSELAAAIESGELSAGSVVAEGIFEGSLTNKFDETKLDYKIRATNDDLYILNETGSLKRQMAMVTTGELIQVIYNGKVTIRSGKMAGKSAHSFEVLRARTA